jgi:hypothetical protein
MRMGKRLMFHLKRWKRMDGKGTPKGASSVH